MKDGMRGTVITKFVVVRPKRYSVNIQKNKIENKSSKFRNVKDVEKPASKELFLVILWINSRIKREQTSFRNADHKAFAVNNSQIAMCNLYNK